MKRVDTANVTCHTGHRWILRPSEVLWSSRLGFQITFGPAFISWKTHIAENSRQKPRRTNGPKQRWTILRERQIRMATRNIQDVTSKVEGSSWRSRQTEYDIIALTESKNNLRIENLVNLSQVNREESKKEWVVVALSLLVRKKRWVTFTSFFENFGSI